MEITSRDNAVSTSGLSGNQVGKASSMAHAAVDSVMETADEAALKVKPAIDQIGSVAHKTVDRAVEAVTPTADWLTAKSESLKATQKKVVDGTYQYVSENPLKSLGIAVLAGYLISRISRITLK